MPPHFLRKHTLRLGLFLVVLLLVQVALYDSSQGKAEAQGVVRYVSETATGTSNGSSWGDAFIDLQMALAAASPGDEIWVAQGTYKPTSGADRNTSFVLADEVALYGGFAGTEASLDERNSDPVTNGTILSGDIGFTGVITDNVYHVVDASGTSPSAVLDGFTIRDGHATGVANQGSGGGLLNVSGSPTLRNLIIRDNFAETYGGGMYNLSPPDATASAPTLVDVTFLNNESSNWGGGMASNGVDAGSSCGASLTGVTFEGNTAASAGGGMHVGDCAPILHKVHFESNTSGQGGGMKASGGDPQLHDVVFLNNIAQWGGGLRTDLSNPQLKNVTFTDNDASESGGGYLVHDGTPEMAGVAFINNTASNRGGGLYVEGGSPIMINTVFSLNAAGTSGGGIHTILGDGPTLANSILWGNTPDQIVGPAAVSYSDVQGGGFAGTGNIDADPLFVDAASGNLDLQLTSPAIDAGDNSLVPVGVTTDLAGRPRFFDVSTVADTGSGAAPIVDMGAYEAGVLYALPDATGTCVGWMEACDLHLALEIAVPGNEIWAGAGIYKPSDVITPFLSLELRGGVAVYGGFAGVETDRNQRDLDANESILSGDLLGNDGPDFTGMDDNSFHVVKAGSVDATAILDGFTIYGGYANGFDAVDKNGGGMLIINGSPTLRNLRFVLNKATRGGGLYSEGGAPSLLNVIFERNTAEGTAADPHCDGALLGDGGGGMFSTGSPNLSNVTFSLNQAAEMGGGYLNCGGDPILDRVVFTSNTAQYGGGMRSHGYAQMTNVTFLENEALKGAETNTCGGAMHNWGNATLVNVLFDGNYSDGLWGGGGFCNSRSTVPGSESDPILLNTTFVHNTALDTGGAFANHKGYPDLVNTIIYANSAPNGPSISDYQLFGSPTISNSLVEGSSGSGPGWNSTVGIDGGGNIDADPLFVDADGPDGIAGTVDDDLRLQRGSPAIDSGDNTVCPLTDLLGVERPQDGDDDVGDVAVCDMGAFELPSPVAHDDEVTTDEDTPKDIDALANDDDVNGAPLIDSVGAPFSGTVTINPTLDGIIFDPASDFEFLSVGVASQVTFTYTISETGLTDAATVTVTVNGVNDPPVPDAQYVITTKDTPVTITLTATDAESDPLTYAIAEPPLHGSVSGAAPNLSYVPDVGYVGVDTFSFLVSDVIFAQVSAGWQHTCGLRSDGLVACWGNNDHGQASPPMESASFTQVAAGQQHTCGLRNDGKVVCWGNDDAGQASAPPGAFTQVSAGYQHTCAIQDGGQVVCWGSDDAGQASAPPGVFTQVSAGYQHTCAVPDDGQVVCWGNNNYGQASAPPGAFTQVSSGNQYTCARQQDGQVLCWGSNSVLQASPPRALWSSLAPVPATSAFMSAAIALEDGRVYLIGGDTWREVEAYKPATDTWVEEPLAPLPTPRYAAAVASSGDQIFVVGGSVSFNESDYKDTNEAYDPATNTWTALSPMPGLHRAYGQAVSDAVGNIYVIGGRLFASCFQCSADTVQVYYPATDTWDYRASMPVARQQFAAAELDGKIYAAGGCSTSGDCIGSAGNRMDVYDIATDSWSTVSPMPDSRYAFGLVAMNGRLFALGGLDEFGDPIEAVNEYDPATDTWKSVTQLPTPRRLSAASSGTTIFTFGASVTEGMDLLNFTQVSAGNEHTCGLQDGGQIACWGNGPEWSLSAVFSQVSVGGGHTCGLRVDGLVSCWGGDSYANAAIVTVYVQPPLLVNSLDDNDDGACNISHCSLREVIQATNEHPNEGVPDIIQFDVSGTIVVGSSPLPAITEAVIIEGNDQIQLLGTPGSGASGLRIQASDSSVSGLTISGFDGAGIEVLSGIGNTFHDNRIYGNGGLGIDLGGDGVTANDFGDLDTGPNNLLNAPILQRAVISGTQTLIQGYLSGAADESFELAFFGNASCDASFYGEGESPLAVAIATTDNGGYGAFKVTLPSVVAEGTAVTALATSTAGDTSEFSRCLVAGLNNDSWPNALPIELQAHSPLAGSASQYISSPSQSKWFRFPVPPNSTAIVELTSLPANYDLVLFRDIAQTYETLKAPTDLVELTELNAEFAPEMFTPEMFTPEMFTPEMFTPEMFTPEMFTPEMFTPEMFTPEMFTPEMFTPEMFTPEMFTPEMFTPEMFTPEMFTPEMFTPEMFTPEMFTPEMFTPDQRYFSSAQAQSAVAVSAFDGTADETVVANSWSRAGDFYARVRGRNGVFNPTAPFTLNVTILGDECVGLTDLGFAPDTSGIQPGDTKTLILIDYARLGAAFDDLGTLPTALDDLASRTNGVVVDVSQFAEINLASEQADASPECVFAKNLVAYAIKDVVDAYRSDNPIEDVVVVGSDDIIPFFRYPDLALLANEDGYEPPVKDLTASQASLRLGYVLSQDTYGASIEIDRRNTSLPIPELPVGRLVERPDEIAAVISAFLDDGLAPLVPSKALVTGYDFLDDGARAVKADFAEGLGGGGTVESLISAANVAPMEAWNADELLTALLDSGRHDLIYLAGHFTAHSALAADYETRILASEIAASPADMTNTVIFSAGCHSGYNIVNEHGVPQVTVEPDWAQAFASKGAHLIAGTGYQYGDTDFVEYSERLYLEFARALREGIGPVSIGDALVRAKQKYLADTSHMRGIHEKVLLEATLFGLPMLEINMPAGRGELPGEPSIVNAITGFGSNPGYSLGLKFSDITVSTPVTPNVKLLASVVDDTTVQTTYYEGQDGLVINPGEPILPLEQFNVAVDNMVLRGIGFRGGEYTDHTDLIPLISAATTEIRGIHTPFITPVFYPPVAWQANYFDALANAGEGETRLAVIPAQYQSKAGDAFEGTIRTFDAMSFRLYYSDNIASYTNETSSITNIPALASPLNIARVLAWEENGEIVFEVEVTGDPSAGIQEVWVTWTACSAASGCSGTWASLDLIQVEGQSTLFRGFLALGETPAEDVQFIAQAASGVGLASLSTNKGAYYRANVDPGAPSTPPGEVTPVPVAPTTLSLLAPPPSGRYGTDVTFTATLSSAGSPLAGKPVVFGLTSQRLMAKTDENGIARATLTLIGEPRTDTIRVAFDGDQAYAAASDSAPFAIEPIPTHLTLQTTTPTYKYKAGGSAADITISVTDDTGRPIREKSVLLVVVGDAGVVYAETVVTNLYGYAVVRSVDLPQSGPEYQVTAYFSDDVRVNDVDIDLTNPRYQASQPASLTLKQNTPPVAEAGGPYTVDEGGSVVLDAGSSSDVDTGQPLTYRWDLNDDGHYETAGMTPILSAATLDGPSNLVVGMQVCDPLKECDTDTAMVVVKNVAPILSVPATQLANEGAMTDFDLGTFADLGDDGPWQVTVNWGDGTPPDSSSASAAGDLSNISYAYDDDGTYTVQVEVVEEQGAGASGSASFQVVVANVAPTATFMADSPVEEGNSFTLSLTNPSDPSTADAQVGFEYAFDCGDGYGDFSASSTASCQTDDNGTRTVAGRIKDKDEGVSTYQTSVTIENVAPLVGAIVAPLEPVSVNYPVNVSAAFSDPAGDKDAPHVCTIDFGDGLGAQAGLVDGFGCSGAHAYASLGVYTVVLTVTDKDGDSGSVLYEYIVVFDPSEGFVTGGGWIDSPSGAYSQDASLTGKASFGFVSKFKKGTTIPAGQTEFQFRAADFNFHSESYQWLVVNKSEARAQFKGRGTINGNLAPNGQEYYFMIWAEDGELRDPVEPDTFRIKIWWEGDEGEIVVYDNGLSALGFDGAQTISGGNIKIHHGAS